MSLHGRSRGAAAAACRAVVYAAGALLALTTATACTTTAQEPRTRDPGHAAVRFNGESLPYAVFGVYVLPGQESTIEIINADASAGYRARAESGALEEIVHSQAWMWTAPPTPGVYRITLMSERQPAIRLNAFVMVPARALEGGKVRGYLVGRYPDDLPQARADYSAPAGFVEVTAANASTKVSPHFRLGQFVCKQGTAYPKFVVLHERLIVTLERILEAVNRAGYDAPTLHVMSGYRTPAYNAALGNVERSRHLFGDAADVFVDAHPRDGRMDDLDGNGRVDIADAAVLYDLVSGLAPGSASSTFEGGLGLYGATASHGPFVHVDTRGYRARWGRGAAAGGGSTKRVVGDSRHGLMHSRAPAADAAGHSKAR